MERDITIEKLYEIVEQYSDEELLQSMCEYLKSILHIKNEGADFVLIVVGLGESKMAISSSLGEEKHVREVVNVAYKKMDKSVRGKMN